MLYTQRIDLVNQIIEKISKHETLSDEELKYVKETLTDPLQEFCMREGTFRLREILQGISPERAAELEEEAAEVVRDVIDYDEPLYDRIDNELSQLLDDKQITIEDDKVVDYGKILDHFNELI